jgi:sugar phosphate permease
MLLVVGMFGMFFLGALYLQRVLGYDPLEVGLAFLPATLVMGTLSLRASGPVSMRFDARAILVVCLAAIGAAMLLFARAPVDGAYARDVLPIMVLFGFGAGLAFPVLMQLAMSGATPSDAGLASGLANTTPQVGGAIGLAVLATIAASRTDALLGRGESATAALNGGFHVAYLVGAVLVLGAIAVVFLVVRPVAHPATGRGEAPEGVRAPDAEPAYSEA